MSDPSVEVVVPLCRSAVLGPLLRSFARQSRLPDVLTLVTNFDPIVIVSFVRRAAESLPFPVRQLSWTTDAYYHGRGDVGLRRNVALFGTNDTSHILYFDDDQIAPPNLIESALGYLELGPFVWGHHRFIDFTGVDLDDLATWPASKGRPRENPPQGPQGWPSGYAGLLLAERQALRAHHGFDMIYTLGSEDQNLARRILGDNQLLVWEPPFAWHPEGTRLPADLLVAPNGCAPETHVLRRRMRPDPPPMPLRQTWGYLKCERCPWMQPADPPEACVHFLGPIVPFDPTQVQWAYTPVR